MFAARQPTMTVAVAAAVGIAFVVVLAAGCDRVGVSFAPLSLSYAYARKNLRSPAKMPAIHPGTVHARTIRAPAQ